MTSPYDQIRADVAAAEAADQAKDTQHAADQATIAADEAKIAADQAEIAELEAELHPAPATLWGVNATTATEHDANGSLFAPKVWRYYLPAGKIAWPTTYPLGDGETFVLSFKASPADILSGSRDADILTMLRQAPADRPLFLDYWHEPEDEIKNGTFTAAAYRDAFAHVAALARQVGPHIRMTLILMNYTLLKSSGRNWLDYYPGDAAVDVIAWDAYQKNSSYESPTGPADLFKAGAAAAASKGKAWAIAECGVNGTNFTGQAQLDALTALARSAAAATPPPVFVTYFNIGVVGLNTTKVAAWKAGAVSA